MICTIQALLISILGVSGTLAGPFAMVNRNAIANERCDNIMKQHGLTARFPGVIAHALHSLTLQDIQYYFNPHATSDVKIPSINQDLSSDTPILFDVVDLPSRNHFVTIGMKVVDEVLTHMDEDDYMAKGYSPLENLVHGLHMHEEWQRISVAYKTLLKNPPTNKEVCPCVVDIESNGVLEMLRYMALILREPTLMYGMYEKIGDGFVQGDGNVYRYNFNAEEDKHITKNNKKAGDEEKNGNGFAQWDGNVYRYDFVAEGDENLMLNAGEDNHLTKINENAGDEEKNRNGFAQWDGNVYRYDFVSEGDENLMKDNKQTFPKLDSSAHWQVWKNASEKHVQHDFDEAALFLYCTLE